MFDFGLFFSRKYPYKELIEKFNTILNYIKLQLLQNVKENKEQLFLTDDTKEHKEYIKYLNTPCDSIVCGITPNLIGTNTKCGYWDNTYSYPNVISSTSVDSENILPGYGIKASSTERLVENVISSTINPYYPSSQLPNYELKAIELAECYTHPITNQLKTHAYKIFEPVFKEDTMFDSELIFSANNIVIDEFTDGSLEPHYFIEASPTKEQYNEYLKNIQPGITINFISKTTDNLTIQINDSFRFIDIFKIVDSLNNEVYKDEQHAVFTADDIFNNRDRYV